jgi:hypothetical protein
MGGAFEGAANGQVGFRVADYLMFALVYFALSFTVIYFNAALVSAAYDLQSGQKPTIRGALDAAYLQLPVILGWAFFATTIGLIVDRIRAEGGLFRILAYVLDAVWAYATYFVVPLLVVEGLSPFDALKRSTSLINQTWGKQLVANFGFGIAYLVLLATALLPVLVAFTMSTALGIAAAAVYGVPLLICGVLVLLTMDGIFRTALYRFATTGNANGGFSERMLRSAYVEKNKRGAW